MHSNQIQPAHLDERAYTVAKKLGKELDCKRVATLRQGPPSWVYIVSQDSSTTASKYVIRLTVNSSTSDLLLKTQQEMILTDALKRSGASMQSFVGEAILLEGFVATISEYLPGIIDDYKLFGGAIARLHLAGETIAGTYSVAPFAPLERTRKAYDFLSQLNSTGNAFGVAGTVFPKELLLLFRQELEKGEGLVLEIEELMAKKNYPYTILHHDVHIGNVRGSEKGDAVLIDLDRITRGPAEYDLTRPLSQWSQRFGRPQIHVDDFMKGYLDTRHKPIDKRILDLSVKISALRYSVSLICAAIESTERSDVRDDWNLREGIRRLSNLNNPNFKWESRETYIARTQTGLS